MCLLKNFKNLNILDLKSSLFIINHIVTKSHEHDSDNDDDFKHAYTIAVFLLVKL